MGNDWGLSYYQGAEDQALELHNECQHFIVRSCDKVLSSNLMAMTLLIRHLTVSLLIPQLV